MAFEQAEAFKTTDWLRLQMLAPLVEGYFKKPGHHSLAEIRRNETLLGATVADRILSPEMKAKIETFNAQEHDRTRDPSAPRDRAAFARFFDGMRLIPPGITPICDWRNDTPPDRRPPATEVGIYGAVARIH